MLALLLIAEGETQTLLTVTGLVTSALATFGVAYLTYRSGRDKMAFDAELRELRAEAVATKKELAECKVSHASDHAHLVELQARGEAHQRASAKIEGELAGANRELTSLRQEVDNLRDRLHGAIGGGKP